MASAAKPLQERFSVPLLAVQRMAGSARQAEHQKGEAKVFHWRALSTMPPVKAQGYQRPVILA
jgi:hypothetical protein